MRVDNGDGTWSYAGPSTTPPDQTLGALTLRYDGQERFAVAPDPNDAEVTWVEPEYVLTGVEYDPVSYLDFVSVDELGRRWVVADVDLDAITAEVATDDAAVAWDSGATPGIEWNPDAGASHVLGLTSFTPLDCGTPGVVHFENDQNDPMVATSAPMDATERLAVLVRTWTGSDYEACSGVLVRDDAVLTAAHCVTDGNGNFYGSSDITVCTMENLDVNASGGKVPGCYGVATKSKPTGYTGTNPYHLEHDYAVLILERGTGLGEMPITTVSDTQVFVQEDHLLGYPHWHPDCSSLNYDADDCATSDNRHIGRELYAATGDVEAIVLTPTAKWNTSFGNGTSGGPHFLCAAGNCAFPQVTGLQAGVGIDCEGMPAVCDYIAVGPKASAFRTVVETMLAYPPQETCPKFGLEEVDFANNPPPNPVAFDPALFSPTCQVASAPGYGTSICTNTLAYEPSPGATPQDEIVVFLPGTGTAPSENDFPLQYAAYAGFCTIGLSYANEWDTSGWCRDRSEMSDDDSTIVCHDADQTDVLDDYTDECPFWIRKERITGANDGRSTVDLTWPNWPPTDPEVQEHFEYLDGFPMQDSVAYRLLYALWALQTADPDSECAWGTYFNDLDDTLDWSPSGITWTTPQEPSWMNAIHWNQLVLAGWSQGSGHAGWINATEGVAGLFLLDGPSDMCLEDATDDDSGRAASYYADLSSGGAPRFGTYHVQSGLDSPAGPIPGSNPFPAFNDANRPVGWDGQFPDHDYPAPEGLRMPSCDDQDWDATVAGAEPSGTTGVPQLKRSAYPPIGGAPAFTPMGLFTDQATGGGAVCTKHESVALSSRAGGANCMPAASGFATVPEEALLYEAYVQGFCALGEE